MLTVSVNVFLSIFGSLKLSEKLREALSDTHTVGADPSRSYPRQVLI